MSYLAYSGLTMSTLTNSSCTGSYYFTGLYRRSSSHILSRISLICSVVIYMSSRYIILSVNRCSSMWCSIFSYFRNIGIRMSCGISGCFSWFCDIVDCLSRLIIDIWSIFRDIRLRCYVSWIIYWLVSSFVLLYIRLIMRIIGCCISLRNISWLLSLINRFLTTAISISFMIINISCVLSLWMLILIILVKFFIWILRNI